LENGVKLTKGEREVDDVIDISVLAVSIQYHQLRSPICRAAKTSERWESEGCRPPPLALGYALSMSGLCTIMDRSKLLSRRIFNSFGSMYST